MSVGINQNGFAFAGILRSNGQAAGEIGAKEGQRRRCEDASKMRAAAAPCSRRSCRAEGKKMRRAEPKDEEDLKSGVAGGGPPRDDSQRRRDTRAFRTSRGEKPSGAEVFFRKSEKVQENRRGSKARPGSTRKEEVGGNTARRRARHGSKTRRRHTQRK